MLNGNFTLAVVGRVGADPETKSVKDTTVTKIRIAVKRRQGKEEVSDWYDVEMWGKLAETAGDVITKGRLVIFTGSGKVETWEDKKSSEKRSKFVIAAEAFQLLDPKGGSDAGSPPAGKKKSSKRSDDDDDDDSLPDPWETDSDDPPF